MIGGLISDVVLIGAVVLIFGGFYYWARRRGLVAAEPQAERSPTGRHVSLLTEAVAYVGAILLLAGGAAAVRQQWHHFTSWEQVAVFAGAAAAFLVAGAAVRRVQEPAVQRLVGVLWFVSSAGVAAATALAVSDVYGKSGGVVVLTIGLVLTAYSAALWLLRRRALQSVALFAGLVVTVTGTVETVASHPGVALALALWGLGLAWALLGWRRYVEPLWVAVPLGVLLALIAPAFAVTDHGWVYAIAIGTATAIMALSVPLRNTVLLGLGTVATFGYVTAAVVRYFQHSLGVPATLAVTGLLVLGLALITARLLRVTHPGKHQAPAAAGRGPSTGETPTAGEKPVIEEKPAVEEGAEQRHFRKAS
jgi:uncharacterized membrane protein